MSAPSTQARRRKAVGLKRSTDRNVSTAPRARENKAPASQVGTLLRGLSILKCFAESNAELGASEIARLTRLPQPTVWRLCRTLQNEGYLVADPGGTRFRPGVAVLGLGFAVLNRLSFAEHARPELMRIAADFQSVAGIAAPERGAMRVIQRVQSPDAMLIFNIRLAQAFPIATSSSGWAYLAALDERARRAVIATLAKEQKDAWRKAQRDFQSALATYRDSGVLINIETYHPGMSSISVPLVSPKTGSIFCLYCSGLSSLLTRDVLANKLAPRLKKVAATLRLALAAEEPMT
jgi:DNA-binding IclR family transcriptional regulator